MLVPIFEKGECVYTSPKLTEIREHCQKEVNDLWEEVRRFDNHHRYYVDLSQKLYDLKVKMLDDISKKQLL